MRRKTKIPLDRTEEIAYYLNDFKHRRIGAINMSYERLVKLISEQFGMEPEEITEDTGFEDLGADSVDLVELSMNLEEEFGIEELGEAEATSITTVGDLVRLIQSKID